MRTVTLTAGFLLAFASTSAHAQLQSRPVPARAVESFTFQSPSMGVRFSLNVGLPQGYKAGDGKKYPALIVTDGDFVFGNVYESASTLGGVITPLFIISVGTSLDEGEGVMGPLSMVRCPWLGAASGGHGVLRGEMRIAWRREGSSVGWVFWKCNKAAWRTGGRKIYGMGKGTRADENVCPTGIGQANAISAPSSMPSTLASS